MKENRISRAGKSAGTSPPREVNPPGRILVVDDDSDIRGINATVLDHAGYRVDTADDGECAWEALGVSRYDLMITDNNMPNLTGMQLLRRLHATRRALPFIMATGIMPEEEFTQCPWLQPAAKLIKPYTVEELLGVVEKVLRKADGIDTRSQVRRGHGLKNVKSPQIGKPASAPVQCRTKPCHRILIVEDEPDLRQLNAEVLVSHGYQVDTAADGKAGWKALHATRHAPESYALLITDHDMPGLSGLALVKRARAARMALPVIVTTGTMPTEDLVTRYPWLHPAAALVKPYSIEQLLGTVQLVLHAADDARLDIWPPPNRPKPPSDDGFQL